jgi:hypothetical protein
MHKLTSLEAQRVTSVLDETLASLNLLTFLPEGPTQAMQDDLTARLQEGGANGAKSGLGMLWKLEVSEGGGGRGRREGG